MKNFHSSLKEVQDGGRIVIIYILSKNEAKTLQHQKEVFKVLNLPKEHSGGNFCRKVEIIIPFHENGNNILSLEIFILCKYVLQSKI